MNPLRRCALALLVLALLAAACSGGEGGSGGDKEIGRVGDTVILLSQIQALYQEEQPLDDGFRESLFSFMALEALSQALQDEYGLEVDPGEVDGYLTQLEATLGEQGITPAALLGIPNASLEMVRFQARVWALKDAALDVLVVDPELVDRLFADPARLTAVCAKHILVATEGAAELVKARLEAGADFAGTADEVSLDRASAGGDLGCSPASDYVPAFAQATLEAPIGEFFGPVQTEFGFHVLLVSLRTTPTREQYLLGPRLALSNSQLTAIWADWFGTVLAGVDAWVAEEYGAWTPFGVTPPS